MGGLRQALGDGKKARDTSRLYLAGTIASWHQSRERVVPATVRRTRPQIFRTPIGRARRSCCPARKCQTTNLRRFPMTSQTLDDIDHDRRRPLVEAKPARDAMPSSVMRC
jgi:hypothetical protein